MAPSRILVLCTRRLGDVLLSTALIRSLRLAYPAAAIDVLTLSSSAAALEGNPDIRKVIALPPGAGVWQSLRAIGGLRAYDLAISTLIDDRPHLLAFCAAPLRASVVPFKGQPGGGWKRWLTQIKSERNRPDLHTVEQYLRIADALGIARHSRLVPPRPAAGTQRNSPWPDGVAYAVVHPVPMFSYKAWTVEGWTGLIAGLRERGLQVLLTGGPSATERDYVEALFQRCGGAGAGVENLAGRTTLAQLTALLDGARIFVGPDTSVTHLAAASGVKTIALFGPSTPVHWGPWPQGYDEAAPSPWTLVAPLQHRSNVWIVQGIKHCVPCMAEGCDRNLTSRADCLDQMPAGRVLAVVDQALRA